MGHVKSVLNENINLEVIHMEKNVLKVIKIFVISFICASLIFSIIVSQAEHHLETCHEDNCAICHIIHIAKTIISISFAYIILYVFVGFLIYYILSRLHKENFVFVQSSLIFQKVQLNE